MQLIWVAGPAGKVVRLSITTRTVALLVAGLAIFLLILGVVFHWIGWRVAIEHVPELAHRLGGVTSQSEQDRLEATYRAKLAHLNQQLLAVGEQLKKLEETKNQALVLFTAGQGRPELGPRRPPEPAAALGSDTVAA